MDHRAHRLEVAGAGDNRVLNGERGADRPVPQHQGGGFLDGQAMFASDINDFAGVVEEGVDDVVL